MKLYCFYDSQLGVYAPPFVARNDADAVRSLHLFAKEQPKSLPITYSEMFFVVCLGDWDDAKGITAVEEPPRTLGNVSSLLGEQAKE